ncbi:acetoacetyl-CoA synthetase [Trichonephila clavata]|uniref:Acetoacetyl-CoA synthetase n=1 Tax=Trichonephila clavata TaxID=2740835 RepID=A0A8X6JC19_TRICU|nr:acetoacetyl-CoA synthetase [Trichonephila clavata]
MNYRDFKNVQVMWHPDGYVSERRKRFIKHIEDKYHVKLGNYWDLHKWSVENLENLWTEVWDFSELIYSRKYDKVF